MSSFAGDVFRTPLPRNYERETNEIASVRSAAPAHPLQSIASRPANKVDVMAAITTPAEDPLSTKANFSKEVIVDPLSASLSSKAAIVDDPLSASLSTRPTSATTTTETVSHSLESVRQASLEVQDSGLSAPWRAKKLQIRKDYTVAGKITLNATAITDFIGSGVEDGTSTRKVDKYDRRLANLEQRVASVNETVELSQKEYEAHVLRLEHDLDRGLCDFLST
jgi:hypothetical protein